jgi:hypothetical protein
LTTVAREDADGDGVENETELLAGTNPGDEKDRPAAERIAKLSERKAELTKFLASYRWQPFERVERPSLPAVKHSEWCAIPSMPSSAQSTMRVD